MDFSRERELTMAKAKNRVSKNGSSKGAEEYSIPDGFNISVGRERGDGWAKKKPGNVILGRLLGRHTYENRGKERAYYQVKLLKSCEAEIENPDYDDEDEEGMKEQNIPERISTTLSEGSIINIDESAKLADLKSRCGDGGVYDVWFVYGNKVDIGNGQTMWEVVGPRLKMVEKPSEIPF
jgi:hypothetical protein